MTSRPRPTRRCTRAQRRTTHRWPGRPAGELLAARAGRELRGVAPSRRWTSWRGLGLDPIELRIRNEPAFDPKRASLKQSRPGGLCAKAPERFGWCPAIQPLGTRKRGRWSSGRVAARLSADNCPQPRVPLTQAGRYRVRIACRRHRHGRWTALARSRPTRSRCPWSGCSWRSRQCPAAGVPAWGSTGTASWGWAIVDAAQKLRTRLRDEQRRRPAGLEATAPSTESRGAAVLDARLRAQFAEVA